MDEPNLLWNRVAMRAALLNGAAEAANRGEEDAQAAYEAALTNVKDPWADHLTSRGYFGECPAVNQSYACAWHRKQLNGATILSLVHAGAATTPAADPASTTVARTVSALNAAFCNAYPVNRRDLPGILYGRYLTDKYGTNDGRQRGNPWVLLTAALANLLYRAATSATTSAPTDEVLTAWRNTFGADFGTAAGGGQCDGAHA